MKKIIKDDLMMSRLIKTGALSMDDKTKVANDMKRDFEINYEPKIKNDVVNQIKDLPISKFKNVDIKELLQETASSYIDDYMKQYIEKNKDKFGTEDINDITDMLNDACHARYF